MLFLSGLHPRVRRRAVSGALALSVLAVTPGVAGRDATQPPAAPPTAQPSSRVNSALDALTKAAERAGGSVTVLAVDAASGRVIVAHDEHRAMNPASNAKLITAAAALELLGPTHRYVTGLYGRIRGGVVDALVLRSMGDPSLATKDIWDLARSARDSGVTKVRGVAVDQSYFDEKFTPPAFDEQPEEWATFRAPVSAVSLNENTVTFIVRPSEPGQAARVAVDPPGFVTLSGSVDTTDTKKPEAMQLALAERDGRLTAKLGGSLPARGVARIARRVEDPRLLAGYALREALAAVGIEVEGEVSLGGQAEKRAIALHRSEPLSELLLELGKHSDNFYAETIFKTIGAEKKARPGSAEGAAEVVTAWLKSSGSYEDGVVIHNGSGLFTGQSLTASSLCKVLRRAWASPSVGPEFIAGLAIGGVDGTLRGRFKPLAKTRRVRAKTGTLNAVASLSGYVLATDGGSPIVFSILVNDVAGKVSAMRSPMDKLVLALAASDSP